MQCSAALPLPLVALWPLGTAFFFAFYMLSTRAVSGYMPPVAMQFHTSWVGLCFCLPVMVLAEGTGWPEFDPVWPLWATVGFGSAYTPFARKQVTALGPGSSFW